MSPRARSRGQPVVALFLLLVGWVALRAAAWETPFPHVAGSHAERAPHTALADVPKPAVPEQPMQEQAYAKAPLPVLPAPVEPLGALPGPVRVPAARSLLPAMPAPLPLSNAATAASAAPAEPAPQAAPYVPLAQQARPASRWTGDAWLLLRRDTTTAITSGRGSYGQSQAGAVIRYRLFPQSPHRPAAYLRASQALGGAKESELALGLSARPVPGLPLTLAAEARVTEVSGRAELRPAAYAVTELPPFALPAGFEGEAYAQAGYVGGDFSSAFVDGQLRVQRKLARTGAVELSAGGGAWGGAQKGAARLDVGPGATLAFGPEMANSRLSVDWRFRVVGEAQPSSGPALTLSAGF